MPAMNRANQISNTLFWFFFQEKTKRLQKECAMLSESLPVSRGSSVFVRVDNDRVDVMRAVIIGPKGTRKNDGEKFNEKIVEKK